MKSCCGVIGTSFCLAVLICLACGGILLAETAPAASDHLGEARKCQSCHSAALYRKGFQASVHGRNTCASCHVDIADPVRHMTGEDKPVPVNCGICHRDIAVRFKKDVHYIKQNFQCGDCHQNIHSIRKSGEGLKAAAVKNCSQCHDHKNYTLFGHSGALLKGNADAASCTDCHGLHNTPYYDPSLERDNTTERENYTRRCRSCHADAKMAKRNRFSTKTVAVYDETHHGKVLNIGYAQRVAGCADCHLGHNILPKDDPRSAMYPDNLKTACRGCHKGFHDRFVSFNAHPEPLDPMNSLSLYWTNLLMIALSGVIFAFFWVHVILWWRRAYSDKCCEGKAGFIEMTTPPECREEKQIQRFSIRDRVMHMLLVLSFFILVMTGFPVKYYDSPWARILINIWGGPYRAGIFHRIAALALCALFIYNLWASMRFLFPKMQFRGFRQRLFGPDSLFPNLKDVKDIIGMFKWFLGKGEMPKFGRWTYWEKLDFLAVFWGITVIGGSGFVLWFPEAFSHLFPGWTINVVAVIHSEGAFLAAIFIFTVHFFNNHLVPDKFPMESNIFTGRYRLEALRHERRLEYERLVAEGRLDAMKREGPGFYTQLFASVFGLSSLILGLLLTGLIFWAALFY